MHYTIKSQLLAIIFLLSVSLFSTVSAEVGQLTNEQVKTLMDENVPIIDIRRPDEWKSTGVIKGSHLLTFFDDKGDYDLDKWLQNLDKIVKKDQKFVLVCRSGNRTGQVTQFLDTQLHYTKVNHLKKGIKRWIGAGDQVVSAK
jgi:rhodanese-related sulfurtransferase